MIEKYRVSEVASDLGTSSKELIALLDQQFPGESRKSQTAMSPQELNFVFEHFTQDHSLASLDEYFALKNQAPKLKPRVKTAAKTAEKPEVKAPKTDLPKSEVTKTVEKEESKKEVAKVKTTKVETSKTAPEPKEVASPATSDIAPERAADRPSKVHEATKPASAKREAGLSQGVQEHSRGIDPVRSASRQGGQRSAMGGQHFARSAQQQASSAKPLPAPPAFDDSKPIEIKMQQPKQKAKNSQSRQPRHVGPVSNVVVDMRSSEVNLERYNERYEQIAPAAQKEMVMKKQKLNQRSAARKGGRKMLSRKEREEEKLRRLELEKQRRQRLEVTLPEEITVGDLAALLKVQAGEIIKKLMQNGIMATVNEVLDYDTAALVAMDIGAKVSKEVVVTIEDRLFVQEEDDTFQEPRSPIVVVMGHVDHGKTSLLDAIRNTAVVAGEAGGITQHIGAYQVEVDGKPITFLDTPGHAAFTAMRARGAQVTDIAVLVVAADDGIMPQTIEAIDHAKEAGVSIIVAINKMDKPEANPDKIKQQLTEHGLVPEEWGGDIICVPVSAKSRQGLDDLLENILLVAEIKELKANPQRMAKGTVIEAKLDKGRGPVATVLIQTGTLRSGDIIIAGTAVGRVRVMRNDRGQIVEEAGPSVPVEIMGLADVPAAGDTFNAVEDEKLARELAEQRRAQAKEEQFKAYQKVTLENLFDHITEGEVLELPVIVKADVQGSVEAVKQSLEKLSNGEVRVRVIHGSVGAVSESDVMLAAASRAIIVGFNVRPDPIAQQNAERDGVDIRLYRIIYDAIEQIEAAMKGMLAPKTKEVELGRAEVRQVYNITGVGKVAGCYVLDGKLSRNASIRLVRDGIIITDVKLASLKRYKDDAKEVAAGYECGVTLEKTADIKVGDIFEAYEIQEVKD